MLGVGLSCRLPAMMLGLKKIRQWTTLNCLIAMIHETTEDLIR